MVLHDVLREAVLKGYKITEEGNVIGARGSELKKTIANNGYYKFSIRFNKDRQNVMVHQLQAYQKFGEGMFKEGTVVRHLDDDSLNNNIMNIEIGTSTDNAQDKIRNNG